MIEVSQHNTVRLLEMNDGKVNFLSHPLRTALLAALTEADHDPSVAAVVLAGRGSCFCAGLNIDDFESGSALTEPSLHNEILDCLSEISRPVVAAIHGGAHGGGLELALGCHYRIASRGTKVSLPEVLVGVMPGARGTQHLPRAIGLPAAADMILNGRRVAVETAPPGLIDQVVEADLLEEACAFAREVAHTRPIPRLQDVSVSDDGTDLRGFLPEGGPAYPGIDPAIAMLKASADRPYRMAVDEEFAAFSALQESDASQKFRAAFLANLKANSEKKRRAVS